MKLIQAVRWQRKNRHHMQGEKQIVIRPKAINRKSRSLSFARFQPGKQTMRIAEAQRSQEMT